MPDLALIPFLEKGTADRSVIVGAPPEFNLFAVLKTATDIRIAMAFGHMSGWSEIENAVEHSSAQLVRVLLGQSFFQTEPQVLLRLKDLQQSSRSPRFEVKLASVVATFHPKVWIIGHSKTPVCVVGSGNLSRGGLCSNVECGIFTGNHDQISTLRDWFDGLWTLTLPLDRTLDEYLRKYHKIDAARKPVEALIDAAINDQVDNEATWRRRRAIDLATEYWRSAEGIKAVKQREIGIAQMRKSLNYPSLKFDAAGWSEFLRIPELGRIRLGHERQTVAELSKLKSVLQRVVQQLTPVESSVELLQTITGIGRNLATKLLAMCQPEKFVVVNEPVESALRGFGYQVESGPGITGKAYKQFLQDLTNFIDECDAVGLKAAPALDAFFYAYKDLAGLP
jgi:hypothetical protein